MKFAAAVMLAVVAAIAGGRPRAQEAPYDLVLAGGTVIDGTGAAGRVADVGIRAGRVAAIGDLSRATATERVSVAGLAVAPGFIDVHTHADNVAEHPGAGNF